MIIGLIPARYDSSRLPGKPLLKFGNKTMIQMVYERTCRSVYIDKTYVLHPDEIVKQSVEWILAETSSCIEVNILKSNPEWMDIEYFSLQNIHARWYYDMYGK